MQTSDQGQTEAVSASFQSIVDGLNTAIFVVDEKRIILLANKAATDLFGEGFVGQDFVRAMRHPDCLEAIDEVMCGQPKSEAVITLPTPVRTTYRVNVVSLGSDRSDTAMAVISFDDISHVREAEQMRSDFVANVSHELRSPLTALSGFIETLKGAAKEDESARKKFLEIMEREAMRMNRLIVDLLSLSRVEVDEHVRPKDLVNIISIVEQVITILSSQAKEERKTIRLVKPDSASVLVPGDEDQLMQVFNNLIENALKYGRPESEVVITIMRSEHLVGFRDGLIAIEVRDQGPGILPEHVPRLTERFYRVENSRSRDKGGTGLGLAIVKHITNRHRGRLQIKSEPGKGSTFTVYLPKHSEKSL